ncbi:MAG: hypothetical protein CMO55_02270 [Verrucomicrobiales bacterium]|nr:hypothetical protein [Verrucomicrobiales bacterium]
MKNILLLVAVAAMMLPELEAVEFESEVLPIFQAKCAKCHMEGSSKGGVALDLDEIGKEIGSSKAIVPGDPEKSELIEVVTLPEDDGDHMPPPGKGRPLTEKEIGTIKEWIQAGAAIGGETPAMEKPEPDQGLSKRPDPIDGNWTNKEGKAIKATLVRVDGENAILRMNGKDYPYPIGNLSSESQAIVRKFAEETAKASGS